MTLGYCTITFATRLFVVFGHFKQLIDANAK